MMKCHQFTLFKAALLLLLLQNVVTLASCFLAPASPALKTTTTTSLPAKKPNKKKPNKNTASSQKGFGAAPPTLEEVTSNFPTRLPDNADELPCPCGVGGENYGQCCAPYHRGEKVPETPLRVLQSRYSAFCYRLVKYIIETTHPTSRDYRENKSVWAQDLNQKGMFDSFDFIELVPGAEEDNNDKKAYINFKLKMRGKIKYGETVISERSLFMKNPDTNGWLYASGDVRSEVEGLEDVQLNQ